VKGYEAQSRERKKKAGVVEISPERKVGRPRCHLRNLTHLTNNPIRRLEKRKTKGYRTKLSRFACVTSTFSEWILTTCSCPKSRCSNMPTGPRHKLGEETEG
jgi:hypothetical protein